MDTKALVDASTVLVIVSVMMIAAKTVEIVVTVASAQVAIVAIARMAKAQVARARMARANMTERTGC